MKKIKRKQIKEQSVIVPGSKSISHRMMICACLSKGRSDIHNLLQSDDICLTMDALKHMGAKIDPVEKNMYQVTGFGGRPRPCSTEIYLGNSGTSMRLLAGIAALGDTPYILTGDRRMCERPMRELLDALNQIKVLANSVNAQDNDDQGTPPVVIQGGPRRGGAVKIDCSRSSQYLSSLLMMGPFMENGLDIYLDGPLVSSPYVDLTIDIMKKFNVNVRQMDSFHYRVDGNQTYQPGTFFVEPDLSNAGYFWAIGAITGQMIWVENINGRSLQGDLKQINIFERMGCTLKIEDHRIGVCGSSLTGVDVDMSDTPDAVPAIAVTAAFARGKTRISNIRHLREKECDRIDAMASQLTKMGIRVIQGDDFLEIHGGNPEPARIETFNDHRIAMAFAVPGLVVSGMEIENETCVEKSFPNFWEVFDALAVTGD